MGELENFEKNLQGKGPVVVEAVEGINFEKVGNVVDHRADGDGQHEGLGLRRCAKDFTHHLR